MAENTFTLPSLAKINWFLKIMGKRNDGFHELCTVFQTVSLCDELTFSKYHEIALTCSDRRIPTNEKNLIVKAALELKRKYDVANGAKIHLEKNIPAPGGLGGGSSNAAIALIGLTKLWNIEVEFADLAEIAGNLGSDVPFFLHGGTALGTGRGTEIQPLNDVSENYILIVTPDVNVSTAAAFARLNAVHLTNKTSKSILQICRQDALALDLRQSKLVNDFEKSVFEIEFEIERAKERLLQSGSRRALLSGSGASVFGVFDDENARQTAIDNIKGENNWRVFRVRTISRREYRDLLNLDERFIPKDF